MEAILLTGLTEQGITLMSQFVNRTGDVQTAALGFALVVPRVFKDRRVEIWIEMFSP